MVFPSQANETKGAILQALEKHKSPEKGIGYNKLFDLVQGKIGGSRRTFHKYLNELISAGAVKKDKDTKHKVGVIIYRTESASQEELLIELAERLASMSKTPPIVRRFMDGAPEDWGKACKIIMLSDAIGRVLAKCLPSSMSEWHYATAKITEEGPIRKVEIRMSSEDGKNTGRFEFSIAPREMIEKEERGKPLLMVAQDSITDDEAILLLLYAAKPHTLTAQELANLLEARNLSADLIKEKLNILQKAGRIVARKEAYIVSTSGSKWILKRLEELGLIKPLFQKRMKRLEVLTRIRRKNLEKLQDRGVS